MTPTDDEIAVEADEDRGAGDAVLRGSALLFGARIIGNAGFFVAVLVLAHALTVPHRGQFAFITTASQLTATVSSLGVTQATTIFAAQRAAARGRLLANVLSWAVLSSLVAASLVAVGISMLGSDHRPAGISGAELVLLAAGAVAAAISGSGNAFLIGLRRWRTQALVSASAPWLYALMLAVVWAFPQLDVDRALEVWVAIYVLWAAALVVAALKQVGIQRPDIGLLKESLRFGVRAWVGSLALLLNYRTDQVIMGFIASEAALGIYTVAVNASEILLILPSAAGTAIMPVLARSAGSSLGDRALRTFRVVILVSLGAMLVAATLGSVLLPVVFGDRYRAAVIPFLWLIVGTIGFAACTVFESALFATSAPGLASLPQVASLAVGLTLDFALIPMYGASGAAAATAAAATAAGATACFALRRRVRFAYRELLPGAADVVALRQVVVKLASSLRRFWPSTGGTSV